MDSEKPKFPAPEEVSPKPGNVVEVPKETVKEAKEKTSAVLPETEKVVLPTIPETEKKEAAPVLDLAAIKEARKALGILEENKEFAKFFASYPDAANFNIIQNLKEFQERRERFELKQKTEKKLNELYKKELAYALGIELMDEAQETLKAFINKEARENPERLEELLTQAEAYEKTQKAIDELTKEVNELGGKEAREKALKDLKKEEEVAKWRTGWRGFINPKNSEALGWFFQKERVLGIKMPWGDTKEMAAMRAELEKGAPVKCRLPFFSKKLTEQLAEVEKKVALYESLPAQLEGYKAFFKEFRQNFFKNFEVSKAVFAIVARKARERLIFFVYQGEKDRDLAKLEEAKKYFEELKESGAEFDLEVLKNLGAEEFQARLDQIIERLVGEQLAEKLAAVRTTNKAVNEIAQVLKTVENPEARKSISDVIKQKIKGDASELAQITAQLKQRVEQLTEKLKAAEKAAEETTPPAEEEKKEEMKKTATEKRKIKAKTRKIEEVIETKVKNDPEITKLSKKEQKKLSSIMINKGLLIKITIEALKS